MIIVHKMHTIRNHFAGTVVMDWVLGHGSAQGNMAAHDVAKCAGPVRKPVESHPPHGPRDSTPGCQDQIPGKHASRDSTVRRPGLSWWMPVISSGPAQGSERTGNIASYCGDSVGRLRSLPDLADQQRQRPESPRLAAFLESPFFPKVCWPLFLAINNNGREGARARTAVDERQQARAGGQIPEVQYRKGRPAVLIFEFFLKRFGDSTAGATGMTSQLGACFHGRLRFVEKSIGNCEDCEGVLVSNGNDLHSSLIHLKEYVKSAGNLDYPSRAVMSVSIECEENITTFT
ncbi:hypothetical protein HPB47_002094 [Ixodes persulcatus]|uniref:Uncharacterized protein n=1 Tax=Ixodes persulcatus TaxID=34615 RepID=A0AC60PM79_IXOPE|nr:hypothetical protein HPB47_002094 [Ixodes persulcatus]